MMINEDWTLISNDFDAKVFKRVESMDEYIVQDAIDTGIACAFSMTETTFKVIELSWAINIDVDSINKIITITSSEAKMNDT